MIHTTFHKKPDIRISKNGGHTGTSLLAHSHSTHGHNTYSLSHSLTHTHRETHTERRETPTKRDTHREKVGEGGGGGGEGERKRQADRQTNRQVRSPSLFQRPKLASCSPQVKSLVTHSVFRGDMQGQRKKKTQLLNLKISHHFIATTLERPCSFFMGK